MRHRCKDDSCKVGNESEHDIFSTKQENAPELNKNRDQSNTGEWCGHLKCAGPPHSALFYNLKKVEKKGYINILCHVVMVKIVSEGRF